jgi:hypothetical protein
MRSRLWFFVPFALAIMPVYWSSTYRDLLEQYKYSAMSVAREASHSAPVEFLSSAARNIENLWNR